ncbi:hypothetical protein COTS27_01400 [Spirochaetota bacterium]|nr:hypothetical protein COTS27_01400 [Spirochaetota bacterium]
MYDYLVGSPFICEAGMVTLQVNGVGYEVLLGDLLTGTGYDVTTTDWECSDNALGDEFNQPPTLEPIAKAKAKAGGGSTVKNKGGPLLLRVYIHYYKTEQKTVLYGFRTRLKRDTFRLLLRASGVGPVQALNIVRSREAKSVLALLVNKDKTGLKGIKGLGEKTIGKLILELGKKAGVLLDRYGESPSASSESDVMAKSDPMFTLGEEVRSALKQLEYKEHEINAVLKELRSAVMHEDENKEVPKNLEQALRFALDRLSS